jgi:hypothetical protein
VEGTLSDKRVENAGCSRHGGHSAGRRRAVRLRSVLGVVLILLLTATAAAAAAGVGSVVGLAGACFVDSGGNRRSLKLGMEVAVGDTVEASQTGKLRLRMADGSIVAVAPGTRLTITAYVVAPGGRRESAQLSLTQGLLRAILPAANRPAAFEVDTAISAAAARSTDWFVEASAAQDHIVVLRGSVAVSGKATGHSVLVGVRHATSVAAGQDPQMPRLATAAEIARLLARTEFAKPRRPRRRSERRSEPQYGEPQYAEPQYVPPSETPQPYQPYPQAAPPYQTYPTAPPTIRPPPYRPPSYPVPPTRGGAPPAPGRGGGTPSYNR